MVGVASQLGELAMDTIGRLGLPVLRLNGPDAMHVHRLPARLPRLRAGYAALYAD